MQRSVDVGGIGVWLLWMFDTLNGLLSKVTVSSPEWQKITKANINHVWNIHIIFSVGSMASFHWYLNQLDKNWLYAHRQWVFIFIGLKLRFESKGVLVGRPKEISAWSRNLQRWATEKCLQVFAVRILSSNAT